MENEDSWNLHVDDDTGKTSVVHTWSHMNPYKGKVTSEGSREWSIDGFMNSSEPQQAKDSLRKMMKEQGIEA